MTKPLLAIDIDDTLADSTESLRLMANERTGIELPPEAYKVKGEYWGYYEQVWARHGIDKLYAFADHKAEMEADQSHLLVIQGAQEALMKLARHYRIVLITAREESWESATRLWLNLNFPRIELEVHFTAHRHDEKGLSKGQLCRHLGAELLIDDNDAHCESALAEGIGAIRFGEYGWHNEQNEQIPCCKSWQDVLEYLGVS